jgi:hypothetical protein
VKISHCSYQSFVRTCRSRYRQFRESRVLNSRIAKLAITHCSYRSFRQTVLYEKASQCRLAISPVSRIASSEFANRENREFSLQLSIVQYTTIRKGKSVPDRDIASLRYEYVRRNYLLTYYSQSVGTYFVLVVSKYSS